MTKLEIGKRIDKITDNLIGTEACRIINNFSYPTHIAYGLKYKITPNELDDEEAHNAIFLYCDSLARCGRGACVAINLEGNYLIGSYPLVTLEAWKRGEYETVEE